MSQPLQQEPRAAGLIKQAAFCTCPLEVSIASYLVCGICHRPHQETAVPWHSHQLPCYRQRELCI